MAMVMGEMITKFQQIQDRDGAYEERETEGPNSTERDCDSSSPGCKLCLCKISPQYWALAIGVVDILRSLCLVCYGIHWIIVENAIVAESRLISGDIKTSKVNATQIPFWKRSESMRNVLYPSIVVWSAISLMFGIVLIVGVRKRSSNLLRLWFAYKFSATLASIPLYVWLWLTTDVRLRTIFSWLYASFYLAVIFSLFVVYLTIQDIFRSRRRSTSPGLEM